MMYSEFIDFWLTILPSASFTFSVPIPSIIALATSSLVRPDVDHLVVALAGGNQTRLVLLPGSRRTSFSASSRIGFFLGRDDHVIDADRDTRARREAEAGVHQLVGEDHGFFSNRNDGTRVDQARDRLLLSNSVWQPNGRPSGRISASNRATHGGIDNRGLRRASARLRSATCTSFRRTLTLACSSTARLS